MKDEENNLINNQIRLASNRLPKKSTAIFSILLLTTGCVVTSEKETEEDTPPTSTPSSIEENNDTEESTPAESSSTSSTEYGNSYQLHIYALEDVGNSLLRLRLGVTNNSESSYFFDDGLSDYDNPRTANRVSLLDLDNQTRHLSYNQSDGSCFCSSSNAYIDSGETIHLWVIFPAPPAGVEHMTITTPLTPPFFDIPITESSEKIENSGLQDKEIIPLTMISDNLEDNTGRTENNEEVSIILSSDVLFDTNSSELRADAEEILEQVAIEINEADSEIVNIDGHADNTGDESVNLPLSEERAEAVETVLAETVERNVSFEVVGHGSADPIGDNETEEGRERNRRVSITFEK